MEKVRFSILSLAVLIAMLLSAGPALADGHCDAGFEACIEAADGEEEADDCVDGYLECVGYEEE